MVPGADDNVVVTALVTADNFYYSSARYSMQNLTVRPGGQIIREKGKVGLLILLVHGDLLNEGEIIDYNDYFDMEVKGNLVNNGILRPRNLKMTGANQVISGTHAIESRRFDVNVTDDILTAASDLAFRNCLVTSNVSIANKKLNMGPYALTLASDSISSIRPVRTPANLYIGVIFEGQGHLHVDNAIIGNTIVGDLLLTSNSHVFIRDLTVEGSMVIDEGTTLGVESRLKKLWVKGDFTNYGVMNRDTLYHGTSIMEPSMMYLYAYGNMNNPGSSGVTRMHVVTDGQTVTLKGQYDEDVYLVQAENNDKPGGLVEIHDEVTIHGKLTVQADLAISPSGVLNLTSKRWGSMNHQAAHATIVNEGVIARYHYMNNSWGYRSFKDQAGMGVDFELRDWDDRIEGLDITVFNNQTYPGLPGSTKRWWRITPEGEGTVKGYTLKLYYDEAMLNGQKEENLKVYRSADQGESWEMISYGEHAILDTEEKSITIGVWNVSSSLLTEFGDFVISAGDGSVPVASPIIVDLVGREDIRLGAPNRFAIHLYNVTDFRTNAFFTAVTVTDDIHFKQVEIPTNHGVEIIPIDSIGRANDHTQVFYVPYLGPNETYSFDVVVVGVNMPGKSYMSDVPSITATGLGWTVAKDQAKDYIIDEINRAVDLDEQEQIEYARGLGLTVDQLRIKKEKEGVGIYAVRTVIKEGVEQVSKTNPLTAIIYKVGDAIETTSKVKDSFRRRIFHWLYKETGLYGVEKKEIQVVSGKHKEGRMVNSWDPNEKTGPTGFGNLNHKSEAGLMHYTIFFENLKEATAPAYRVQITDTLSDVFDLASVTFGAVSHVGEQYNWTMERDGHILRWDIEGIELPPNVTPPEGEGYVQFSVRLKDGVPSGTVIENRASIIFDINPPIITNTWVNVLDMEAPVTVMQEIDYSVGDTLVMVSCISTDNPGGSGVERYWFYVSENGGPFALIGESFENSIPFTVPNDANNHYRFYAIAIDHVGNMEVQVPAYSELHTLAVSSESPPVTALPDLPYPNPSAGMFYFDVDVQSNAQLQADIYSLSGKWLKTQQWGQVQPGRHTLTIDMQAFATGVYMARFLIDGVAINHKLVISRH